MNSRSRSHLVATHFSPSITGCAAVQRPRRRVGPVVAEEHSVATHRGHLQADVGKGGAAAARGFVEVHHQRGHALAATPQDGWRARFVGVEVVVVRLVFGAGLVVQHLEALAVLQRPVQQASDAGFHARHLGRLPPGEEHATAGAVGVEFFTTGLGLHGERTRQVRLGRLDQRFALFGAEAGCPAPPRGGCPPTR